ncbi:Kell blood group glyco [Lonchura striata]|uniref:Kell blood group glyco n=1 Tax=Lonchura striata TaxID=40157 RepID=A0A218VD70_9PASE|nr:Kell blood group glyco [Lonchura striata domestica]
MSTVPQTCDQELRTGAKKERCLQGKSLLLCALLLSILLGFTLLITYLMMTCALGSCDAESDPALLARLLNSRNDTVNPCENFYEYACGRWEGKQSSRTREESLNVFDVLLEENLLILKRLLESPQFGIRGSAKEKAIRFYRSCMDTEQIESQGAQPLKDLLNQVNVLCPLPQEENSCREKESGQVGGWHNTGVGETKDFNETLQILMSRYSTFPFFRVHVGPTPFDPKTNIIQIDHPEFDIPLESEFKEKNYLEVTYQRLKKALFCLQEKAPAIDWLACLKAVFHPVPMNLSQPIAVHDMDYLSNMSQLIEKWHKGRVLHIYMIVCLVGNLSPALDSQFQDARLELYKILYGRMGSRMIPAERWRKCLTDTSSFFEPVLGKMIVQEIFPEQTKKFAEQMFSVIQDALCDRLDQVEWMDEQTRRNAKALVSRLQVEIGYPAHMLQTDKVNLEYQNLEINEDTFFLNVVACLKVQRENSYLKLLQHNPQKSAVNFGAIGVFMAHEILHAFYGYVLPEGCPACNRNALQSSIDCLVEQYESYSFNVNGTFTLLENTADTGGLAVAYQAYKNWLKKHKEEDLPKIGLSHDQLFYLSFAHAMCGHQDPEKLQSSLNTDPHSPLPLRVSGPVSNSQDFSKSFQCPSGSPMNPENKCRIW